MAIDNQMLAGTVCVVVICLAFAATSKVDPSDVLDARSPDDGPTPEDIADKYARMYEYNTFWVENNVTMDLAEVKDLLRDVKLLGRGAERMYDAYNGNCDAEREDFNGLYAALRNELEQRESSMEEAAPADMEEVPVNIADVKPSGIPKPKGVTFDQTSQIFGDAPVGDVSVQPTFQTTPSHLDRAVDEFANKETSALTTDDVSRSAFQTSADKLGRPENNDNDPLGSKRAAEETDAGLGIPSAKKLEQVNIEPVAEPVRTIVNASEGEQGIPDAPTFDSMSDPPSSKPPYSGDIVAALVPDPKGDDNIAAKASVIAATVLQTGEQVFNSTGEVEFGDDDIHTRLQNAREAILDAPTLSEKTELLEKMRLLQKQVKEDMSAVEYAQVKQVRSAMGHLYKYDREALKSHTPNVMVGYGGRVRLYVDAVRQARDSLSNAGITGSALQQIKLNLIIAEKISGLYPPATPKRSRAAPVDIEDPKRVRDVETPTAPKRAKTKETVERVAAERDVGTGEPQRKRTATVRKV